MSRGLEALAKIKSEIQNDPKARGYSGNGSSGQAILMNEPISKSPKEFITIKGQWTVERIVSKLKEKFPLSFSDADDPPDTQQEVKESRGTTLELGKIEQGDVEQAMK